MEWMRWRIAKTRKEWMTNIISIVHEPKAAGRRHAFRIIRAIQHKARKGKKPISWRVWCSMQTQLQTTSHRVPFNRIDRTLWRMNAIRKQIWILLKRRRPLMRMVTYRMGGSGERDRFRRMMWTSRIEVFNIAPRCCAIRMWLRDGVCVWIFIAWLTNDTIWPIWLSKSHNTRCHL